MTTQPSSSDPGDRRPGVSLCMIVRDEQALLPRFLEAARGLWDELCAVDTGSKDSTPELLAAAGARVAHRPWNDDFAAARNASLAMARGDWILVLDADEMVSPELVRAMRALVAEGGDGAGAATVRMLNRLPHGHVREARLLRLFRNDPAIRFEHRIHEDASRSVLAALARTGRRLVDLEGGVVEHLGYVRVHAAARDKRGRDERLLRAALADDPRDLYSHFKLLELARFWGDRALARTAAQAASEALATAPRPLASHFGGELVALVAQGLFPREPAAQLRWLGAWEKDLLSSAAFHLARAEQLEVAGEHDAAARAFEAALGCEATTRDRQLATTRPRLGLARLAIARGDARSALALVDVALEQSPRDPEALLARLALARAAGGAGAPAAFARAHEARHGASPDLTRAVGEEALLAGDFGVASRALTAAATEPGSERLALRLAQAQLSLGDLGAARGTLLNAAASKLPEGALGVLVCDLIEGRDSAVEIDLEPAEASAALRGWLDAVLRSRRPELVSRLRDAAPALAEPFPWMVGYIEERAGRLRQ